LFDTNVILDVLLDRAPFASDSKALFALSETRRIAGLVGATTVTTVFYLTRRAIGIRQARTAIGALLKVFDVAAVTRPVLESAIRSDIADFEDAVLLAAAEAAAADAIVTRDPKGFAKSALRIFTPGELRSALAEGAR
jgi:predicted nucleic acid-binding protein